jgi:hypothetical protein
MTKPLDLGFSARSEVFFSSKIFRRIAALIFATGVLSLAASEARAAGYGVNLLLDGNAEQALGTGWNQTGSPAIVQYGAAGGFPTSSDPGPPDRLKAFFAGGSMASSSISQNINVSANAADIDAGKVACDVVAWLGGYLNDGDNAQFDVHFSDGNGKDLLSITLGPVTTADRGGKTGLLSRSQTVAVPAGTRTILANVQMTRENNGGSYNDGYADSLSVVLRGPIVVTTIADSGAGSLRDAIPRATVITFDPTVFAPGSAPHVITLTQLLPDITTDLTITGPGADILAVQSQAAENYATVFLAYGTSSFPPKVKIAALTMSGLTFGVESSNADLTLDHVVIRDMPGGGACLIAAASTVHVSNSLITNNKVANALFLGNSTANLQNCTISGNTSSNGIGVAIYQAGGTLSATGCTISGNSGTPNNSSIVYVNGASLSLANCTISDNSVTSGDTILAAGPSGTTIGLFNDTIAGNFASNSVHSDSFSKITFNNTIFADSGPTFSSTNGGSFSSSPGYNLSTHNDNTVLSQTTDLNGRDPMLGPLQDNGGPTFTRALLPGSLAIDKGNSIFVIDQRGAPRPFDDPNSTNAGNGNNPTDIGAFEFQGTPPVVLANISGRLLVGTGDNALFAGFIVTGYQPKRVIIRAIGPSLGVAGGLADPTLELRDGSGALLQSNDNWKDSPNKQAIIDSTIAPTNDLESAIVATLPASKLGTSYTAIVRGSGNATGIGVVEVYDLDRSLDSKLANISNRGFVQTGDNVLFAGNIVVGQTPQKVIIRALGPSTGVPGAMADPTLELHDANGGLLEANDNWVDSPNKQAIIDSTIPPTNNLESAIVRTLPPANYTAIVRGANNTTGIAVVEVYALN